MNAIVIHPDWREDGVEAGEELWRLDLPDNIQVQLFARVKREDAKPLDYTGKFRLFIEHDVRDASGEQTVRYAGDNFTITREEAVALLAVPKEQTAAYLINNINRVKKMPNDDEVVADRNKPVWGLHSPGSRPAKTKDKQMTVRRAIAELRKFPPGAVLEQASDPEGNEILQTHHFHHTGNVVTLWPKHR